MRVVITGAHHNSALVLAQYFVVHNHRVDWIGHRHSSRGDTNDSAEYLEVTASHIPFHELETGRFIPSLGELLKIPIGFFHALALLKHLSPDKVITFGGYIGATVSAAAYCLGIPIYLHEQTVTAGKANKFIARFAKRIYLTWEQSSRHFPKNKSSLVGLPLRPSILESQALKLFFRRKPTLLVMGGKLGAHRLNHFVFSHLNELLAHFNLVHQTGTSSLTRDYEHALELVNSLGSLADSYLPLGYIPENQIGKYLRSANYYLGRSGAHICYELALVKLPSILVPLPTTHDSEQRKNAQILVDANLAVLLPQSDLSLPHFMDAIKKITNLKPRPLTVPLDATALLYHDILKN